MAVALMVKMTFRTLTLRFLARSHVTKASPQRRDAGVIEDSIWRSKMIVLCELTYDGPGSSIVMVKYSIVHKIYTPPAYE